MVDRVSKNTGTKKTSGGYKGYVRPEASSISERANRKSAGFDSIFKNKVDRFQYDKGNNPLRICPPTFEPNPKNHYFMQVWVHPRQGADHSDYLCLAKMKNKPCAFCDAEKEAREEGEDDEDIKKLKPVEQWVGYVLARESDEADKPLAYKMSFTQDRDLASYCQTPKGAMIYPEDPDDGYDINVRRNGQGLNTKYLISIDRESSPMLESPKKQKTVLDWLAANPISEALEYKKYEYMEQIIKGVVEDKDEDLDDTTDDDDDRGSKKNRKATKGKRRAEEEEEEEDEGDNEEEEAKSDKKNRRKREEPEEEPEEEEEEDDPPPRRGKSRREEPEEEEDDPPPRSRRKREEPEEEEEEEERPTGTRRGKQKPKPSRRGREEEEEEPEEETEEESEEEEEEETEEEDDPPPRRSSGRSGGTRRI